MRYLANNTNIVRDAALTATNALGSEAIYRTDTAPKQGGGLVVLAGPYTGANDTEIEVEVVDNGGGSAQVSQPAFAGVGSGGMSGVTASGVEPQTVTVTLEDLGTDTRAAYAPFQGVTLVAKAAGAGGNAIAIDVDHGALSASSTAWALQDDLRQDANEYVGEHWNFGAAVLEPAGTIPADAPRLRFGNDPQVYRQYKRYRDGRYVYAFSPAPVRDVPRGARVHAVAGTRTLTITNGATTETLAGLVTLYDALTAIRDHSALVRVDGPIVSDRLPGGQAITELSVRTRSYVLGVVNSGTGAIAHAELRVAAADTAPTETLTLTCADASLPGAERWDVRGDVSGALPRATTGLAYAGGKYTLTVPLPEIDPGATSGVMVVEYIPGGQHQPDDPLPALCVDRPRLGIAARDGEWSFTYTRRPPADCDCTTGDLEGGPNDDCLGTSPEGGDVSEASQLIRLQRLKSAVRALVADNTLPPALVDMYDVAWITKSAAIFQDCLARLSGGILQSPPWKPATAYAVDTAAEPTVRNGYRYAVAVAGTSGADEPAWPESVGDTVTDGSVTWLAIGKVPYGMWDEAFEAWQADAEQLNDLVGKTYPRWSPGTLFPQGVVILQSNGHFYRLDDTSIVVDGGGSPVRWMRTGSIEPVWPLTSGTSVREIVPSDDNATETIEGTWIETIADGFEDKITVPAEVKEAFFERYRTIAADILAAAGISTNFDVAGANGDGCWQTFDDAKYWWVFDGREPYLPIFTGHYYHAAKMGMDEAGKPYAYSTREWGFGPRFGCPALLREGDQLRITITGASSSGGRGYQVGDAFAVRVNQAGPLPFGGGQSGDDTLTWSVVCSSAGRLADYALVTTAPAPYSASVGAGALGFAIAPGGIPFALGDAFAFAVEGGRFRWRRDGGAWSGPLDIAEAPLADGLTAAFAGGAAPSWLAGDRWTFRAEATHGVAQLRDPLDGEFAWAGATTIDIAAGGAIVGVLIAGHAIAQDATITLLGSDDDFATTPLVEAIAWQREAIWHAVQADHAAYRIAIDRGGSIRWLYLGESTQLTLSTGAAELGRLVKRVRLPSLAARRALAANVEHSGLPQASVDALLAALDHACEHDDRRLAIVPNDAEADVGLVRINADTIEINDELAFQPRDPAHRLQSLTLQLEAAP
jgi:hypothetical protein